MIWLIGLFVGLGLFKHMYLFQIVCTLRYVDYTITYVVRILDLLLYILSFTNQGRQKPFSWRIAIPLMIVALSGAVSTICFGGNFRTHKSNFDLVVYICSFRKKLRGRRFLYLVVCTYNMRETYIICVCVNDGSDAGLIYRVFEQRPFHNGCNI